MNNPIRWFAFRVQAADSVFKQPVILRAGGGLVSRTRCSALALLRRAGTHLPVRWTPDQQRTTPRRAARCAASGERRAVTPYRAVILRRREAPSRRMTDLG